MLPLSNKNEKGVIMAIKRVLLIGGCLIFNLLMARCSTQMQAWKPPTVTVIATATTSKASHRLSLGIYFDASYIPYIDSGVGIGPLRMRRGLSL